jgi:uncharacterized membrane protein YgcG
MSAAMLQIAIMAAVLGSLVWLAVRRSKPRGALRSSGDPAWSSDAVCNIGDAGQHHGSGGHDGGSAHSGDSGGGSDSGGGDGGGGGSSD